MKPASGHPQPHRRATGVGSTILIAGAGALPLGAWIGGRYWLLDLLNHFQAHYFLFLVVAGGIMGFRRRFRLAALAGCLLIVPVLRLAPLWIPPAPKGAASLRVATLNVLASNTQQGDTIDWIRRERPDVVFLCETTESWSLALLGLDVLYPHAIKHPLQGCFGFTFHSRFPIHDARVTLHGRLQIALLDVVVETPAGPMRVFGAHPVPPVSEFWAGENRDYLQALADLANESPLPTLIVGDLNSTLWGHHLRPLLAAGFRDSARGNGYAATWSPGKPLLGIPIDHVLSRGLGPCVAHDTSPGLGSDHRAVIAGFQTTTQAKDPP